MDIDRDEIVRLTEEYGGVWGINHTRRVLHLTSLIGEGWTYNADAVWLAAHLHDWGAYGKWVQPGVDHALRSKQVAEAFLGERGCPEDLKECVLECIEFHHQAAPGRSLEAMLLFDADALDFLGVVGILREASRNPKDLRKAYNAARKRRQDLPPMLNLPRSKEVAARRVQQMDETLALFEQDSFSCF